MLQILHTIIAIIVLLITEGRTRDLFKTTDGWVAAVLVRVVP